MAARRVAIALVHHPVLDREGGVMTTAITNLDVHDIARSARAYELEAFYVVHPIEAQRELVEKVRSHWVEGGGAKRIPDRKEALGLVRVVTSLDEAAGAFGGAGAAPELWTTAAKA